MRAVAAGITALILTGMLTGGRAHAQVATPHPLVTQAEYERWQTELQLGTLGQRR